MIEVIYDRPSHCLTVEGHAYSGEAGRDLVCSAASILAYTLAASVTNAAGVCQLNTSVRLDSGDAEIMCQTGTDNDGALTMIYDTVCAGYELLAINYPEYISYTIIEG